YTKSSIHLAKISEWSLSLLKILKYEEPCRDVHQREVILSLMMLVQDTLYRKSPSPVFVWCSVFRMFSGTESLAWGVQFSTGSAVWHDRAVWHESEQFSSELNNISLV
ncbi:hypothetical protein Tco_1208665, partial [Tanacetum coccineum]